MRAMVASTDAQVPQPSLQSELPTYIRELNPEELASVAGGVSVDVEFNSFSDIDFADAAIFAAGGAVLGGGLGAAVGAGSSIAADLVDVRVNF